MFDIGGSTYVTMNLLCAPRGMPSGALTVLYERRGELTTLYRLFLVVLSIQQPRRTD